MFPVWATALNQDIERVFPQGAGQVKVLCDKLHWLAVQELKGWHDLSQVGLTGHKDVEDSLKALTACKQVLQIECIGLKLWEILSLCYHFDLGAFATFEIINKNCFISLFMTYAMLNLLT